MKRIFVFVCIGLMVLSSGCATRSSAKVSGGVIQASGVVLAPVAAESVFITEGDVSDREYESLGDIHVRVSKTTIFNKDPTRQMVAEKLQEKAASMGADAVVMVQYGEVGMSLMSYGKIDGRGKAIKFVD